jgi:hypothetical protein
MHGSNLIKKKRLSRAYFKTILNEYDENRPSDTIRLYL